jgi:long-chain acyl-CoA synthetase
MTPNANFTFSLQSSVLTPNNLGVKKLEECLKKHKTICAQQSKSDPIASQNDEQQWLICETSGTSGTPKAIRRTPASWMASFDITADRFSISQDDVYAVLGSLAHSLTLFGTLEAFHIGADLCLLSQFNPRQQVNELDAHKVSIIYATPTQLKLLVGAATDIPLPNVRHVFSGGGKLDQGLKDALLRFFPDAQIHEFFGASETSFITLSDSKTPISSVGKPYPNVVVRIGADHEYEHFSVGEIWVSSPYLFDGYTSGEMFNTRWDGPFLSIGEMGFIDDNGYLHLKGRTDRMVTVADKNVFPDEIEQLVNGIDGVSLCAVVPLPDAKRGNRLVCFVQATEPVPLASTIRARCRAELGQSSVPKEFIFLDHLPLLPAGKPDLVELQKRLEKPS